VREVFSGFRAAHAHIRVKVRKKKLHEHLERAGRVTKHQGIKRGRKGENNKLM